jgi:hypothetical protein
MHAKDFRQAAMAPRAAGTDHSQRILGGVLWLGLTVLLIYISS